MAKKKPRRGSRKAQTLMQSAMKMLDRAKMYASPTQWARIHDVQSRIATAQGKRRAFNRKRASAATKGGD